MTNKTSKIRLQDVAEIVIGAVLLGFPIAVSEEVWNISRELTLGRTLLISFSSICLIAWFGYYMFYGSDLRARRWEFFLRISAVYLITLVVSAAILTGIDHFPLLAEPVVAVKRMIIVALPASFSATIVDSLHHPSNR